MSHGSKRVVQFVEKKKQKKKKKEVVRCGLYADAVQ